MDKGKNVKYNKNKKREKLNSTITISILVCIALIALIGIFYKVIVDNSKPGYVSLNLINVTISSGEKNYTLSLKVTLSGKSKNLNKLNMENIQLFVNETVKKLDYDSITSEDGTEYIKNVILTSLRQEFGDTIEDVNLESLLTDVSVPNEGEGENKTPSVDELLKDFSWSKNKNK